MSIYLRALIALAWVANGWYAKMLNGVPRHRQIVARILGDRHAPDITRLIGVGELLMAVWVLSGYWPRWCMWSQIGLVLLMNLWEFILVPDLLLWGRYNLFFALVFCGFLYWAYS